jgi:hypothetical protein
VLPRTRLADDALRTVPALLACRGAEITGTFRTKGTRDQAWSAPGQTGPPPGYIIGISAGQSYRTSSPVTVRPISIRWISDVPSKMVKIVD